MSSIKDLGALGAFVTDELVKREISFVVDGEEKKAEIFVKKISVGMHEDIFRPAVVGEHASSTARLLSEAIRLGEKGEERMTYLQAFSLLPAIARAMTIEISKVNGSERKN